MAGCSGQSPRLRQARQKSGMTIPVGESITVCFQVFPDPVHDHYCIACGSIAELLQEFIKGVAVSSDAVVGVGENVFEEPRSLGRGIHMKSSKDKKTYEMSHPEHIFE
jgi:hypothetical protein